MRNRLSWLKGSTAHAARPEFEDLTRVVAFFVRLILIGVIATAAYAYGLAGMKFVGSVLWALGFLAAGGGAGFLFGIPKVLQGSVAPPPAPARPNAAAADTPEKTPHSDAAILHYRQRVNTNLEEISDWLTKIIVGVSLIQLKSVPDLVWRLAGVVSGSLGAALPVGFGVAVFIFFAPVGFLFGYLVTRLYIQGALARAERSIEEEGIRAERELTLQSNAAQREVDDALKGAGAQTPGKTIAESQVSGDAAMEQLKELADRYLRVRAESWAERVRLKNDLAAQMAAVIIQNSLSRDELSRSTHEGILIGLAAAIQHSPQAGDPGRLVAAAPVTSRLHVQYRFVLAFARLLDGDLLSPQDKAAVIEVLNTFEARADGSLRSAIIGLRRRLEGTR
jgi:hypothetical protein